MFRKASGIKNLVLVVAASLLTIGLQVTAAEVLVVANEPLSASDTWIVERIQFLGHNVTVVDDNAAVAGSAADKDMIFISSSIDATVLGATFRDVNLPIMLLDVELQADMGMTGSVAGTDYGTLDDDRLHIIDHSHPMAAAITGNRTTVEKQVVTMGWGKPNSSAIKIAKSINDKNKINAYEYPPGAVMVNGQAAPDRRIYFFAQDTTELNALGIKMFDAAVAFALSSSANVVTIAATTSLASEESTTAGTFTVTRSGSTKSAITVTYTVSGTAAADGSDYAVLSGTVVIAANSSSATITVTPVDDAVEEVAETVIVTLAAGTGFSLGNPSSATVTIADNDSLVVVPTVDAGPDQITNAEVNQDATVVNANSVAWTQESGQGRITFGSANQVDTTISANQEGVYVLRLTATGANRVTAFDEINFTWDVTPPVFGVVPQDSTAEATSPAGAIVNYTAATATDNLTALTITYSHPSGGTFALGDTLVTVTASDAAGNATSATFTVSVVDTTAPLIVAPDIIAEASDASGAAVTYAATVTDAVSTPTVSYSIPSGSVFANGVTPVTVTATDVAGNSSTATFNVTVQDNTAPVVISGPTAVPNPALIGETVAFSCTASDIQALTWNWNFGDGTPDSPDASATTHVYAAAGTYTATLTVTDAGNLSTVRTLEVVVNAAPGTPPPDFDGDGTPDEFDSDDDNDGASDAEELAAGTNPLDANSVLKKPMTITKVGASAKFNATGKDQFQVSGIIPDLPKTFTPLDKNFSIDLGGAIGTFKLDAKGRAKTATGMLRLKYKTVKNKATKKKEFIGGPIQFQVKIKGALGAKWTDEGVDPTKDKKKVALPFVIDVSFDGVVYTDTPSTVYSSKAQKGGAFKFSRKIKK